MSASEAASTERNGNGPASERERKWNRFGPGTGTDPLGNGNWNGTRNGNLWKSKTKRMRSLNPLWKRVGTETETLPSGPSPSLPKRKFVTEGRTDPSGHAVRAGSVVRAERRLDRAPSLGTHHFRTRFILKRRGRSQNVPIASPRSREWSLLCCSVRTRGLENGGPRGKSPWYLRIDAPTALNPKPRPFSRFNIISCQNAVFPKDASRLKPPFPPSTAEPARTAWPNGPAFLIKAALPFLDWVARPHSQAFPFPFPRVSKAVLGSASVSVPRRFPCSFPFPFPRVSRFPAPKRVPFSFSSTVSSTVYTGLEKAELRRSRASGWWRSCCNNRRPLYAGCDRPAGGP